MNSAYKELVVETYLDTSHRRPRRVRPVAGQGYDTFLNIECSESMRESAPIGSLFVIQVKTKGDTNLPYTYHGWPYRQVSREEADRLIALATTGRNN